MRIDGLNYDFVNDPCRDSGQASVDAPTMEAIALAVIDRLVPNTVKLEGLVAMPFGSNTSRIANTCLYFQENWDKFPDRIKDLLREHLAVQEYDDFVQISCV